MHRFRQLQISDAEGYFFHCLLLALIEASGEVEVLDGEADEAGADAGGAAFYAFELLFFGWGADRLLHIIFFNDN